MKDLAAAIVETNQGAALAIRRGVVTQVSPLLVKVGAADTAAPATALGSYVPVVGEVVTLLEQGPDRVVLGPTGLSLTDPLADQWVSMDLNNGSATTPTVFGTAYNLINPAPVDLTMTVSAFAHVGFSTGSPGLQLSVRNQAGTNITKNTDGYAYADLNGAKWIPMSVMGSFDYSAGDAVGCALAYAVTANNTYVRAGVRVQFARR